MVILKWLEKKKLKCGLSNESNIKALNFLLRSKNITLHKKSKKIFCRYIYYLCNRFDFFCDILRNYPYSRFHSTRLQCQWRSCEMKFWSNLFHEKLTLKKGNNVKAGERGQNLEKCFFNILFYASLGFVVSGVWKF